MRWSLLVVFVLWSSHDVYAQLQVTLVQNPPMVFPQILSPSDNGIEVKFTSSDTITDATLDSCRSCFEATYNASIQSVIIKRSQSSWTTCTGELLDSGESNSDANPSIKRCETRIEFRSDTDQVLLSDLVRLYINRQPQDTYNPADLSKIQFNENSLEDTHVAYITINDPDESNSNYRSRRVEITSCELNCPWKLQPVRQVDGCSSNTSCISDNQREDVYALSLIRELDYETAAVEQILLRITDAIDRPDRERNVISKPITVRVIDVQDTPPQFVAYQPFYSVNELQPEGTHLFSVRAIDGDRATPSSIYYELCQTDNSGQCVDSKFLNIITNASTGAGDVYIKQRFTIEEVVDSTIILNITAIEDTPQDARTVISVRILVMDIDNHRAEFFLLNSGGTTQATSSFEASVEENSLSGSPLQVAPGQQIFIEDRDRGGNAHFKIYLSPNDTFEISPSDAQGSAFISIRVKDNQQLDAETIRDQFYNLAIHTRGDGENPHESSATVQITVVDVNDHPTNIKDCTESQPISITVDELVFINTRQTVLNVGLESNLTSDVDYDIVNRNTTRFRLYRFDDPSFTVTESGSVDVVGRLDYETAQFHQIFIEADNVGRNGILMTSKCTIHVNITDANDETPQLVGSSAQSEYNIDENELMNFPEIQVLDKDTTASLNFSLRLDRAQRPNGTEVSQTDFDLDQHIDIETSRHADNSTIWGCTLKVIKSFDRETTSVIYAIVTISDTNADSRLPPQIIEHRILITVRDLNDNPPKLFFNNDDHEVKDALQLEVAEEDVNVVYLFTVTDEDSVPKPTNFKPSLLFPEDFEIYADHLTISNISAQRIQLKVVKAFDWRIDAANYVNFSLVVHDDGNNGNSSTISIHLRIIDRNNMRPEIRFPPSNHKFLIRETNVSEAEVFPLFNVTAEDLDSEEFKPLSYRISLINAPLIRDVVDINSETGEVFLRKSVDREEPGFDQEFPVFLTVIDNANKLTNNLFSETIPITLQIKDINDNLPIFANDTQDTVLLLPRQNFAGFVLPFRLKVLDADAPDQCGFLTYSLSGVETIPVSLNSDNSLVLNGNISGGLAEFHYNVYDGSKPDCAPGHSVSRKLTIKILQQANLYQLTIELDDDAPGEAREKSEPAQNVLKNIAVQYGMEFVYYDIEQKTRITRAKSQWLLAFSFLNQTTGEPVGSQQITSLLIQNQERLISVGVVGIGGSSGTNTGGQEGLTTAEIGAIVLGIFLGLTLILIIVYAVETNKLKRKLRSYRAAESIEVKRMPGGEPDSLPNYSSTVTKVNPLFKADGNPATAVGHFQESDSLSDVVSETGSTSSGESENVEDLEAVVARTNRQNLNHRLH